MCAPLNWNKSFPYSRDSRSNTGLALSEDWAAYSDSKLTVVDCPTSGNLPLLPLEGRMCYGTGHAELIACSGNEWSEETSGERPKTNDPTTACLAAQIGVMRATMWRNWL
jgi:hypothetical protein